MKKIALIAAALVAVSFSTAADAGFVSNAIGRGQVESKLSEEGYTDINIEWAYFNRAPIQCKDAEIFLYKAKRKGKPVEGFACWRGWVWGVAHWDK